MPGGVGWGGRYGSGGGGSRSDGVVAVVVLV